MVGSSPFPMSSSMAGTFLPFVKRSCKVLANVLLVSAVVVMAAGVPGARAGAASQAPARFLEGPSEAMAGAQMQRAR